MLGVKAERGKRVFSLALGLAQGPHIDWYKRLDGGRIWASLDQVNRGEDEEGKLETTLMW